MHGVGGVAPRPRPISNKCNTCDNMYNYLPHPSNMRTTDQVLAMRIREGAAGYGIYMMLLELLRDAEGRALVNNPAHLAFACNEPDVELVRRVIADYGLFTLGEDGRVSSPWLESAMDEYDAKRRAAQEAGRRGAAKRYGKQESAAPRPYEADDADKGPHRDPIGGGMGSLKADHANITNNTLSNETLQNPPQGKSKLLALAWGNLKGEDLMRLCRESADSVGSDEREYARKIDARMDGGPGKTYHAEYVYTFCEALNLNKKVFNLMLELTHNGHTGTSGYVRMVKIAQNLNKTGFKPTFANEYVLTKMIEK